MLHLVPPTGFSPHDVPSLLCTFCFPHSSPHTQGPLTITFPVDSIHRERLEDFSGQIIVSRELLLLVRFVCSQLAPLVFFLTIKCWTEQTRHCLHGSQSLSKKAFTPLPSIKTNLLLNDALNAQTVVVSCFSYENEVL